MSDPTTLGPAGVPYLAVDVQPDDAAGVFVLDVSELDGPDRLAWGAEGAWVNIVCDVTEAAGHSGATRHQGVLTRTEAGAVTITATDWAGQLDPLANGEAIHRGTPLRLRAWGSRPQLGTVVIRQNRALNPRQVAAGWSGWLGGTVAWLTDLSAPWPLPTAVRSTPTGPWTTIGLADIPATGVGAVQYAVRLYAATGAGTSNWVLQNLTLNEAVTATKYAPVTTLRNDVAGSGSLAVGDAQGAFYEWRFTVPPSSAAFTLGLKDVSGGAGGSATVTAVLVEAAAAAGSPYFDGDTPTEGTGYSVGDKVHTWTGPADASWSSRSAVYVAGQQSWTEVLFTGQVDEVTASYSPDSPPQVVITGSDLVAQLSGWSSRGRAAPGVGAGERLRARAQRVLNEVQIPGAAIAADSDADAVYAATLAPTLLAEPWDAITDAADAELGRVWVNRANQLVLRGRGSQLSGPVRGTLSDVHAERPSGAHCCIGGADVRHGAELLANLVTAQREGGTLIEARRDDYSVARYGPGSVNGSGLVLEDDAQLGPWAEAVVISSTRPELRVDSVQPAPAPTDLDAAVQAWPAVCATAIGDRWLFRFTPWGSTRVERTLGVLGVDFALTPDGWAFTWLTAEAPTPGHGSTVGWFVLDVSELDSGDLLAPYSQPLPA